MANRFGPERNDIILHNQSAFIKKRSIHDKTSCMFVTQLIDFTAI
jgi:hypothetical protein